LRHLKTTRACRRCGAQDSVTGRGRSVCDACIAASPRHRHVRTRQAAQDQGKTLEAHLEALGRSGEALSPSQIAALLGCTTQYVRLIERRALRKFREAWLRIVGEPLGD
jgi:hypothetical protein